jgi:3',5'-cyclic AMP phosphodiesterase CpdA
MKKILSSILIIMLLMTSVLLLTSCKEEEPEPEPFSFRILQLADPQYSASFLLWRTTNDLLTQVINDTEPDLIVLTGDQIEGPGNIQMYTDFMDFLDTFQIPYAITFGNHDSEFGNNRAELAALCETGEYSVFEPGPENVYGYGNYIYNVRKADDTIAWSLVMMDSNDYIDRVSLNGYDCIHQDQIDWYTSEITSLKAANGGSLNSLMFFHIPLPEFSEAWDNREAEGVDWLTGEKNENVACSKLDIGFFDVIKNLDSTRGIFVGHDHVNNYVIKYEGITLGYGLKSGYGSYSRDNMHGGTVIDLTDEGFTVQHVYVEK